MGKKIITILITLAVVLGFSNASMSWKGDKNGGGGGYNFVDEDGDGICDNYNDGGRPGYSDEDGDGICDNCNNGGCPGYSDEDGDGICDNYNNGGCPGYSDEDGDGVCDNRGGGRNFPGYGDRERRRGMPLINILDGMPFTYDGEVIRVGYYGSGTIIATEDGEVTLYGLGPRWYWDCKEISRPEAGDLIEVSGYTLEYNDIQRNITTSITIGDETIELRDSETGVPLWRGGSRWICP